MILILSGHASGISDCRNESEVMVLLVITIYLLGIVV
jgi:hypothetical protein